MKRLLKVCGWVMAGFAALALAGLVGGLSRVDYQPYFRTSYHAATTARLGALAANWPIVAGPLEAGFGKAPLTPRLKAAQEDPAKGQFQAVPLAGYGARHGQPASGTHDELFVKAVAFKVAGQTGVIVSADALIIPREVAEAAAAQLQRELKLARPQVYFAATHTHASLGGWGQGRVAEAFAGKFQPGVRAWFAGQLVAAVRAALADLTPASFGHGGFAVPGRVRNRLVGAKGKVDDEFSFAVVKQADGDLATLGVFAAHATVLPDRVMAFSGDYPGYWQRAVERATGGLAVFLAGGVGSHGPVADGAEFVGAQRLGESLAEEVLRHLPETPMTNRIALGVLGLEVALPELHARVTDGLRLRPGLAKHLLPVSDHALLQAFRLGGSIWLSTPCDFSGELALGIKDWARARGRQAVITSFNGDYIGYVIPARYYHLAGYEPRMMSFFGPNVPDYFDELLRSLATLACREPAQPALSR
jgi:hypothetical protein